MVHIFHQKIMKALEISSLNEPCIRKPILQELCNENCFAIRGPAPLTFRL